MLKRYYFIFLISFLVVIAVTYILIHYQESSFEVNENQVINVLDGDTFVLGNGEHVRLICIDAPEIYQAKGLESKYYLEGLILGKEVRLERDFNDEDSYGRKLRYVYLETGTFVNKEMVVSGNARIFRYGEDVSKCDEIEDNSFLLN